MGNFYYVYIASDPINYTLPFLPHHVSQQVMSPGGLSPPICLLCLSPSVCLCLSVSPVSPQAHKGHCLSLVHPLPENWLFSPPEFFGFFSINIDPIWALF